MVNDWVNFKEMKEWLDLTDGNLASHITALEKSHYIEIRKAFVGKKPETSYRLTALGKIEFKNHIKALSELLK
jgi:DNA-binding PadR family transcriptional regulator